jgi:hypothetical protein
MMGGKLTHRGRMDMLELIQDYLENLHRRYFEMHLTESLDIVEQMEELCNKALELESPN